MRINKIYKFAAFCCSLLIVVSCDYERINTNQFEMTEREGIMDGFALGGLITSMEQCVFPVGTQSNGTVIINQYQIAYLLSADAWSGFISQNNSWDAGNNNTSYYLKDDWIAATYKNSYTNILDSWKKLKAASEKNNTPEVYALAQILKISAWHKTLESFGPMPYTHAADHTLKIPFDSEKDVYTAIFKELTEAIDILSQKAETGASVMPGYDAVYAGNAAKWVRYANSLMLRFAMRVRFADEPMAKKYAAQALKHSIGVMKNVADEAKMAQGAGLKFVNNIYWTSDSYNESRMGSSMFSYLIGYEDPRLGAYFSQVAEDCRDGVEAYDGKKYQAVPAGHTYGQNDTYKLYSKPNFTADTPTYWMRTSEVLFLQAEAALAWGGDFGDAESLYMLGIKTSFAENGKDSSVDEYVNSGKKPVGHKIRNWQYGCDIPAPCSTTAAFKGDTEQKLEKIMIQKWIALFPNGHEAWTEWRRTGYPKLNPVMQNRGAFQGSDTKNGVRRMMYPQSFYSTKEGKELYDKALSLMNNGKGGEDKSSTRLWWDCR